MEETKSSRSRRIGGPKMVRRFLEDADGPVQGMELDCLSPHVGTGTILASVPAHLQPDNAVFPIFDIIAGPLEVTPLKAEKWNVPAYTLLK